MSPVLDAPMIGFFIPKWLDWLMSIFLAWSAFSLVSAILVGVRADPRGSARPSGLPDVPSQALDPSPRADQRPEAVREESGSMHLSKIAVAILLVVIGLLLA